MKKLILCSLFALIFVCATAQPNNEQPYVEVQGNATRLVEPNRIEVRVTLSEAQSKGKVSLSVLESQLATALKTAGIDASKQLVLASQSSSAQKKMSAYQFKTFLLTLHSAAEVKAVFDAFDDNGVQDAAINRTYNTEQAKIDKELQIEAMINSKEIATNLTQAIGQTIGRAIQIQFWNNSSPIGYGSDVNMMRSKSTSVIETLPDDIEMRPINTRCSVTVRYELPKE